MSMEETPSPRLRPYQFELLEMLEVRRFTTLIIRDASNEVKEEDRLKENDENIPEPSDLVQQPDINEENAGGDVGEEKQLDSQMMPSPASPECDMDKEDDKEVVTVDKEKKKKKKRNWLIRKSKKTPACIEKENADGDVGEEKQLDSQMMPSPASPEGTKDKEDDKEIVTVDKDKKKKKKRNWFRKSKKAQACKKEINAGGDVREEEQLDFQINQSPASSEGTKDKEDDKKVVTVVKDKKKKRKRNWFWESKETQACKKEVTEGDGKDELKLNSKIIPSPASPESVMGKENVDEVHIEIDTDSKKKEKKIKKTNTKKTDGKKVNNFFRCMLSCFVKPKTSD